MGNTRQKGAILALCDPEEEYVELLGEFLRKHQNLPWEVHTYTQIDDLLQGVRPGPELMLVVAESVYSEELERLSPLCTALLNESGTLHFDQLCNVDKYQQAEQIFKELLELYLLSSGEEPKRLSAEYHTKFIGIYSPIHRCLQTSFALTLSQLLAKEHSTLYLNFEHYVGIQELLPERQSRDLADLLYFLTGDESKFGLRMETVVQHRGELDYIPPMRNGQNLQEIPAADWRKLFERIEELGNYEYVVMDLSDAMQGLFDTLRLCTHIFTLTKEDRMARSKLNQYEQLLGMCEYRDVWDKTRRLHLPQFARLPEDLEQYTRGDLASYVRREVEGLCMME